MEKSAWYRSAWRKRRTEGEKQIELDLDFGMSSDTWHLLITWLRTGKVVIKSPGLGVLGLYSENGNEIGETRDSDDACQYEDAEYTAYDEDDDIDYEYEEGPIAAEVHLDLADEYRRMKEAGAHLNSKSEDHAEAFIIGRHFPDHFNRGIRRASQLDTYQLSILIKLLHNPSYAADYPKRFIHLFAEILQARLAVNAIHESDHQSRNATAEGENDEFAQLIDLAILADRLQIVEPLRCEIL
ncbi:hypothetical protein HII31_02525 [Pseudocercospora fuligena]|uniref:Uncharacterized protein n=1 Tax=Pseudocercospora fuligena TaxID=685502 RepID=A0A8H6VPV0_9PEZI|nr:hypothetical protein HII31_02525 [Pseudocercospora fuligena]